MSVRLSNMYFRLTALNSSAPTGSFFMKFDISLFLENMPTEFELARDTQNTYILRPITFFFSENRAYFETRWKYLVEPGRQQIKIRRMRVAC